MANIIEIILKGVDKSSQMFKDAEKSSIKLKDVLTGIGAASVGIAAVGATMKKAFDLGREGAVIEQTGESFDYLMQKVKAAPDLMDQLTAASHDTISAFELQSSTMTLLAGAQGELATELANSTPRLLEIAKAANKLNPALGTTSFMYESIATGVKRAQPLILDNLGLTLKVGEANEKYAASIGKTVEEMSAQDRAMAILNATLEAGDELIAQVGGTTESATDDFDRLTVAMKELADAGKKKLTPMLTSAAGALVNLLTAGKKIQGFLDEHHEEIKNTSNSYKAYVEEMKRAATAAGQFAGTEEELIALAAGRGRGIGDLVDVYSLLTEAHWEVWRTSKLNTEADINLINTRFGLGNATEELTEKEKTLTHYTYENAESAKTAAEKNKEFLDSIDRDVGSPIESFIKDIQWFLATGGKFEVAFARLKELAEYAPEEALVIAEDLYGMVIDTQEELGMITADDAADNLETTLGLKLWEAKNLISGTDGIQESMEGLSDVTFEMRGLERFRETTEEILRDLNMMSEAPWEITFSTGGYKPKTISPSVSPRPNTKRQMGGSFIVPPGYNQDNYMMGLSSGERVDVTPRGKGLGNSGSQNVFNIYPSSNIEVEEMVERIAQRIAEN